MAVEDAKPRVTIRDPYRETAVSAWVGRRIMLERDWQCISAELLSALADMPRLPCYKVLMYIDGPDDFLRFALEKRRSENSLGRCPYLFPGINENLYVFRIFIIANFRLSIVCVRSLYLCFWAGKFPKFLWFCPQGVVNCVCRFRCGGLMHASRLGLWQRQRHLFLLPIYRCWWSVRLITFSGSCLFPIIVLWHFVLLSTVVDFMPLLVFATTRVGVLLNTVVLMWSVSCPPQCLSLWGTMDSFVCWGESPLNRLLAILLWVSR